MGSFSVLLDEDGTFKTWYTGASKKQEEEQLWDIGYLCYATSIDGVHWEKLDMGLVEFNGSKKNNIVYQVGDSGIGGCVFKDPTAAPEERYKIIHGDRHLPYVPPKPYGTYGKLCGAVSPDGIHWTPLDENPIMNWYCDAPNVAFWDDSLEKYVAYVRDNDWAVQPPRRARSETDDVKPMERFRRIGRSETNDFRHWPGPEMVLACDDEDPLYTDLYNSATIKYPYAANAYFIFAAPFYHLHDTVDIQLAVSRDGVEWRRAGDRRPFVPIGCDGEFDSPQIYMAPSMTRVGDELSLYYFGHDIGHDATIHAEFTSTLSRVVLRLDGFMSADADYKGGSMTTPLLTFSGSRLELNVDTGAGGTVQVEILDAEGRPVKGFSLADADVVNGNSVRKPVAWKQKGDLRAVRGKPIQLRFAMRDAKLYAFQFVE